MNESFYSALNAWRELYLHDLRSLSTRRLSWDVVLPNACAKRDYFNALPNAQGYGKIRFEEVLHHHRSRHAKELLFWKASHLGGKIESRVVG